MKKSLAQLKRDAKTGNLKVEMVERFGNTDIPESLQGIRTAIKSNTQGITFKNSKGGTSELRIESASLLEYTDKEIVVYNPGTRELTADEQNIFDQWEAKRDKKQEEIDLLTDGSNSYWKRKHFFIDNGYEYLLGHEKKQGKKYDFNTGKVLDNTIKGDVILRYKIVG